ncbi:excinuclease ABC subunit A, partial [Thermogemmatispora onikobensis]|uniref:excinuclease ABC subunit A n=1 Tax=Thermogemmatispora onikobensis TaxID=732234 RepID=UPI000A038D55
MDKIVIRGAREHNLKNIDLTIPRDRLVVITGLSGSGKSSLAFDTIFAEGQRRYVESLSAYARQFLDKMDKPDVDHIDGLSPAISIDQKGATHNPRSTVGTVTEIYDYLRLLYARVGHPHCPRCGREVSRQTVQQIVDVVLQLPEGARIMLLAPLVQGRKGEYKHLFEEMRRSGYVRVRVDGTIYDLSENIELDKQKKHTIEVVVDRLVIHKAGRRATLSMLTPSQVGNNTAPPSSSQASERPALRRVAEEAVPYALPSRSPADQDGNDGEGATSRAVAPAEEGTATLAEQDEVDVAFRQRLADSLETTLKLGNGVALVSIVGGEEVLFSERFACVYCGISLPEIEPRTFSFNSPHGACPACTGLGTQRELDAELLVTNPDLTIREGAIALWSKMVNGSQWESAKLEALAKRFQIDLDRPWRELPPEQQQLILYGTQEPLTIRYTPQHGQTRSYTVTFEGVIPNLERRYRQTESELIREEIETYMSTRLCPECRGARLKPEALAVTVGGRNIVQVTRLSVKQAQRFFQELDAGPAPSLGVQPLIGGHSEDGEPRAPDPLAPIPPNEPLVKVRLSERERLIARQILKEIRARLQFLVDVGLDYLTLDRTAMSLSGGEAQRIRLATQIGSGLMGVLYILDEPSIGLHQRDNHRLIQTLLRLRDLGNTVLVIEHDEDTMRAADYIIDIGPGAGEHGGQVVAAGTFDEVAAHPQSLTGAYLSGRRRIATPTQRRPGNGHFLTIVGARENNLKNITVRIPLGKFV